MKKTFLARRNALLSPGTISLGVVALFLALGLYIVRLVAPDAFLSVVSPVFRFGTSLSTAAYEMTSGFRSAAALSNANHLLMNENAALSAENRALTEKIADLTALLGSSPSPRKGILAGVTARPPESPYDSFVLSAGANDGIEIGMTAFGPGGVPLGEITSVSEAFSHVSLFSKTGTRKNAWIGSARIPTTLVGEGGGAFSAQIPRSVDVALGEAVFMEGPGAVPIGTVAHAGGDESDPMLPLSIKPTLNIFSIAWVVVRPSGTP